MRNRNFYRYARYIIGAGAIYSISKSIIDNVFRKQVKAEFGSVVFCTLLPPLAEHSGIYVGNNEIVHLNRLGNVEKVSYFEFTQNTPAISIYVSSKNGVAVGSIDVGNFALSLVGTKKNYNVLTSNCHQFSSSCLTGIQNNNDSLLYKLKNTAKNTIGANEWLVLALDQ